jgi:Fic family protein
VAIRYELPRGWILYDPRAIVSRLVEAKAAILSLLATPYLRDWVDNLQEIQLKMEVEGTSRIEGADFTPDELRDALAPDSTSRELFTRSQRQAHAAAAVYRWIRDLPPDRPVDESLIREIHRRIVTGCDDDHCEPGRLRGADQNVTFGVPRHRGCEGGAPCQSAFASLMQAVRREFCDHDPLVQALALHYHFAAMHPFLDGNGRTARAAEALMLQRAGLRDTAFIAMSNYYHDEKPKYLETLAEVRRNGHDLTPFLIFGLRGIAIQCQRLHGEIRKLLQRILFRDTANSLFTRLKSARKRVLHERQLKILNVLLEVDEMALSDLAEKTASEYGKIKKSGFAFRRDFSALIAIEAIGIERTGKNAWRVYVNLDWPARITESAFLEAVRILPKTKTFNFLA